MPISADKTIMTINSPLDDLDRAYVDSPYSLTICREAYLEATDYEWADAQRWFACGFTPVDVRRFIVMGMGPEEAQSWGLNASMVERFRALGFTKSQAREWALAGLWPDHAIHWRRRGFTSQMARLVVEHSHSPTAALGWTLVAAQPDEIVHLACIGRKPGPILAQQSADRAGAPA